MTTPRRVRYRMGSAGRVAVIVLLAAGVLAFALTAHAATTPVRHDLYPLTLGDAGPRVCGAQWLLMGHRPSVFRGDRYAPLPAGTPSCYYGARTAAATKKLKYALGYPLEYVNGRFTLDVYRLTTGAKARPLGFIARSARRAAADIRAANPYAGTYAARAIRIAQGEIGCREIPWGSNYSLCIRKYQAITGAFHAPWCASFTQWVFWDSGLGTFANRSAGVFYIRDYARSHGWLRTVPKPGFLVMFLDRLGHIALVERVTTGGIYSIEGNSNNQVLRRFHPHVNYRPKIYAELPGLYAQVSS